MYEHSHRSTLDTFQSWNSAAFKANPVKCLLAVVDVDYTNINYQKAKLIGYLQFPVHRLRM